MKKIIKKIFLFAVIVLSLVFANPTDASALIEQTSYVSINNIQNLEVGSLSFYHISFKDYSSSVLDFGLTGLVKNNSNNEVSYNSFVYYYDSNYNLIAQGRISNTTVPGLETDSFNLMSNLYISDGHSVDEICYYRLSINTNENDVSSEISTISSNTPSENHQYSSYDYVIDKYDINIVVNENNTLDITEVITAYFNVPKHGIYRTIPLKNTITRLDGTTSKNRTQVTNVSVDNEFTTSKEDGNYKLQIGSANQTLTGEQTYVIKYTYNLGKDPLKEADELYYNIIGSEWDTVIGNVTFTITMPKEFDTSKLGFSSGSVGSTDNSKVTYNIDGNKIMGSYNGILGVGKALTVRCELPEGYFVDAGLTVNSSFYLMIIIPILGLVISIFLWYKFGRDEKVVETVEFYPPEGFNSLEVGFLYKGKTGNKDVTSLLIYLANKGYIKIVETEAKSKASKSKDFKITKLKEYDGDNINEKKFLDGLFSCGSHANKVTENDLYNEFYKTKNRILKNINNKENKNKIFKKNKKWKIMIILLIIISLVSIIIIPVLEYAKIEEFGIPLLIWAFFSSLFYGVIIFSAESLLMKIFCLSFSTIFLLLFLFEIIPLADALVDNLICLFGFIIGILCIIGMLICIKYLPKRTAYGNEMLGKLKGFKNFLETAEKDKLEAMVMQNPTYFYDILPFTYVLGVSDKWISKFETISLQAPSWYDSSSTFNVATFGAFMNSTMVSAQSAMSSSPASSSGGGGSSGGSSGGGSSGGGSGGGGGGSW